MTLYDALGTTIVRVDETPSTQTLAKKLVRENPTIGVVLAGHQTSGRGRFDRVWLSERGSSLTVTFLFANNLVAPWLAGMAVACACAAAAKCKVQWPNDLTHGQRKLGGILSEVVGDKLLVGVGINLNQADFACDISGRSTSIFMLTNETVSPEEMLAQILDEFKSTIYPANWQDLDWHRYDETPGKRYRLPDGREVRAIRVLDGGRLECSFGDQVLTVSVADALMG